MEQTIDHVQEYIDAVERGEILIGKKIQQAIDRHKRDLEKSKSDDYPYYYDPTESEKPVTFIGALPDPKSGKPNDLGLFQKFIIGMLYGWRKKKNNTRRFAKVYISVARKNGKSLLVSGIALYELIFGKNPSASRQVYSSANTRDQAKIVFNMVKTQLNALRKHSKSIRDFTKVNRFEIMCDDESFMKPLSSDASTLDGLDVLLGVLDEYGEAKTTEMIDVLQTSMAQQLEGLILIISTTTENLTGPMYSIEYPFITRLLNQEIESETYLALCWEMDSLDEADQEENWIKANPLLENEQVAQNMIEHKRAVFTEAKAKGKLSNYYTKEQNFWMASSEQAYLTAKEWEQAESKKDYDISGRDVYIGIDLSRVNDLTAISWIVPIEEEQVMYLGSHSWVASRGGIQVKEDEHKTPYREYERLGYCSISTREDGMIDFYDMIEWIREFVHHNDLNVKGFYYDPAQSALMVTELSNDFGSNLMVEVRQGYLTLNPPTKQFKTDVLTGRVKYKHNPLLTRAIHNAVVKESDDLWKIDKNKNRNKIDPLDATLNAYVEAMAHDFDAKTIDQLWNDGEFGFGM